MVNVRSYRARSSVTDTVAALHDVCFFVQRDSVYNMGREVLALCLQIVRTGIMNELSTL